MDEKNFDDIEIELGDTNISSPNEEKKQNEIPPIDPKVEKFISAIKKDEEEEPKKENNCQGKNNWLSGIFGCFVGAFGGCVVIPFILFCIMFACIGSSFKNIDKTKSNEDYIAVIPVEGIMTSGRTDVSFLGSSGACGSETVCEQIQKAIDDPKAKGIILRVNSPGGTPAAAEEMGEAIKIAKKSKPVYTSMADLGCSAAYWISSLSSKIYVNRTTMTGSIGVIMNGVDYSGLFDKIGVKSQIIKSGKYKDIGSGSRPMTEEEKVLLQNMLDSTYNAFLDTVSEGRKMPKEKVKSLAEGMIYTGDQAVENHLADKIGTFNSCVEDLAKEVKMNKPVVKNMGKQDFWSKLNEQDLKSALNLFLIGQLKNLSSENQLEIR